MGKCFVCGEDVTDYEESELFGCDGDRIHRRCKPNLNRAYDAINNMSDLEFNEYITGKRDLISY